MVLETAVQEFFITVWIAVWTTVASIAVRWFYIPGTFPFNLIFNFAAVTTTNPDTVLSTENFSWLRQTVRIITDCAVIGLGITSFQCMLIFFEIDSHYAQSPSDILKAMEKNSILAQAVMCILYYISNFALFGSYRLAWNLVCVPFLHAFSLFMQYFWPPAPAN